MRPLAILRRRRRLAANRDGVAALEFALVAAPFFALVVGILEIGLIFLAQTGFERQIDTLARMIKTGQAQDQSWNKSDMQRLICSGMFTGRNCTDDLRLDIQTLGNVSNAGNLTNRGLEDDDSIQLGVGGENVLLRAELDYHPIFSAGGISPMAGTDGGPYTFTAAVAFRNEPF